MASGHLLRGLRRSPSVLQAYHEPGLVLGRLHAACVMGKTIPLLIETRALLS